MPGQVTAVGTGSLTVEKADGKAGGTVAVKILLSGNPGIVSMRLFVAYDSSKLKLLTATDGGLLGTGTVYFGNDLNMNPYTLLWEDALSPVNHTGNGTLAVLTFKILDTASLGSTPVTVTLDKHSTFDVNLDDIPFSVTNGSVGIHAEPAVLFEAVERVLLKKGGAGDDALIVFEYGSGKSVDIRDLLELRESLLQGN